MELLNNIYFTLFLDFYAFSFYSFVCLFFIGFLGLFVKHKNFIYSFMALEIMLLGVFLAFLMASMYLSSLIGQIIALYIIVVAGAEVSIGLSLLILLFRIKGRVSLYKLFFLKG